MNVIISNLPNSFKRLFAVEFSKKALIVNGIIYVLGMDALAIFFLSIGTLALFGLMANDLRRWSLMRDGFFETGVALGDNQDKALDRFLGDTSEIIRETYQ